MNHRYFDLNYFGILVSRNNGKSEFKLVDEFIPYIRKETWEYIVLDLSKESYTSMKTDFNEVNQSLLNSFRSVFIFKLLSFLYGDNKFCINYFMIFL